MLTLRSLLRTTRQMGSYKEGQHFFDERNVNFKRAAASVAVGVATKIAIGAAATGSVVKEIVNRIGKDGDDGPGAVGGEGFGSTGAATGSNGVSEFLWTGTDILAYSFIAYLALSIFARVSEATSEVRHVESRA